MREFKKRRTLASEILRAALGGAGVLALAGVAFLASHAAWDMYGKFAAAASARASAEAQLSDLQDRYKKIDTDVEEFSSPRGVEAAVRERYGVAKPGEGQIDIVREATTTETVRKQSGFFERIWGMLFVW